MSQLLRPISDINSAWTCSTGSNRYACIDEETYSDSDYIYTSGTNDQECKLSEPISSPEAGTGTLRFRGKKSNSIQPLSIGIVIMNGSTIIKSSTFSMTTSYTGKTLSLTEAEMANITDWSDVSVIFYSSAAVSTNKAYVSWVEFEVPDGASNNTGLEMGCLF